MVTILVYIDISNNRNEHSIVAQLYFKSKQTHRKRDEICVTRGRVLGGGETG